LKQNSNEEVKMNMFVRIGLGLCFLWSMASPSYSVDQNLDGQLASLADEIRTFQMNDRIIGGRLMRLDKVSSFGIPDASFDLHIEQGMEQLLKGILDESGKLLLKIEYGYVESDTKTNNGKRVIQMTAKIYDNGRLISKKQNEGELDPLSREVNNSSDIAKLIGITIAPPDSKDHLVRLKTVEDAFETPAFEVIEANRVAAKGAGNYGVEIRKRVAGQGNPLAVPLTAVRGMAFAGVDIGDTYELVIYNYDPDADAIGKIDIDGLDAINTFNTDTDADGKAVVYPGYFIPRATNGQPGKHVIPGWLQTVTPGDNNVLQFVVNELGKGAASAKRVRGKTGVITVQFFEACESTGKIRSRGFGETGTGKPMKVDYTLKQVQIGTEPLSIVSVRYSHAP